MNRKKLLALTGFWGSVCILTILALAGIAIPDMSESRTRPIKLTGQVHARVGDPLQIGLELGDNGDLFHAVLAPDNANRNAVVGSLNLPGNLENVLVDRERQLAFLANSFSGVQVVDISVNDKPKLIGAIAMPGNAWDLELRGTTLFVAAAGGGLQIIDVSEPSKPILVSQLEIPGIALLKLALHDQAIYASGGKKGLLVIDISDISHPKQVSTLYAVDGAWGLTTDDDSLYLSFGKHHFGIYDISNPLAPALTSRIEISGRVWEMAANDHYIYLPTRDDGLLVVDANNRHAPRLVSNSDKQLSLETISLAGNRAYLTNRKNEFFTYALGDPARPERIISANLSFRPRGICAGEDVVYLAGGLSGLQVLDAEKLAPSWTMQTLHHPGSLEKILEDGSYYYLATRQHGLFIAKKQDRQKLPFLVASIPLPAHVKSMARVGSYLYITGDNSGLMIVDINQPEQPRLLASPNLPGYFNNIASGDDQLVYLTSFEDGLYVINTTFPENPILIGHLDLPGARTVTLEGNRIYVVSTETGLHIIDVSDPAKPVAVSQQALPWPLQELARFRQLVVKDNFAYLAAGNAQLIQFDITNESAPQLADIVNVDGEVLSVAVKEEDIYAATRQGRLWRFASNNGVLSRRTVIDIIGNCHEILIQGDKIILANGLKGLTFLPAPQLLDVQKSVKMFTRAGNAQMAKIDVPPGMKPAVYNLVIFEREDLTEFVGAVTISE